MSERESRRDISGTFLRDTILFACVRPTKQGILRLVAVRRAVDGPGRAITQRIAVSEALNVEPWFTLSPTFAAVLSAIAGFVAGLLSHAIQLWLDRRRDNKRSLKDMQAVAMKALVPEFTENAARLKAYVAGGQLAPDLNVTGYNELLGDAGFLAYLDNGSRSMYFSAIKDVYTEIERYMDLKNAGGDAAAQMTAARKVLARLQKPLAPKL
jgi:hypothetical protein